MTTQFDTIEDALAAIAAGDMIVVVDDDDRENEGDLIMAASKATPEKVAFMIRHTSGILCTPILEEHARRLHLDPMVARNDAPMSTAFTVSIDYAQGLTTGISAEERAATSQALANSNVSAEDFVRPGHIFPLVARQGGVLVRSGHTEAGTDLAALAGLPPVGLLAELVNDDGTVQRLPQLLEFAKVHKLRIITIDEFPVNVAPSRHMLFTRHRDMPGIIGHLGSVLGEHNVNIASMQVGRRIVRGDAVMVLSLDDPIPPSLLVSVHAINGIQEAHPVTL